MTASPVPADIVSLGDYERHARERLPASIWSYIAGAGADGLTRGWNREAFDRLKLEGRVLADMYGAHTAIELFGQTLEIPVIVAPVAFHKLAHPDGELATALGAAATGAVMTVSTQASTTIEDIGAAAQGPLWFQLYMQTRREDTLALLHRAEAAGCKAIMVTADAPVNGLRNEEQRAGFRLPEGIGAVNLKGMPGPALRAGPGESPVFKGLLDAAPTWRDLEWLRGRTKLPLLVKGVMSRHDARLALETGVDGIVVSNHGGRVLDTLPATIEALPAIADELGGRLPVLLDGGVRRGTDILKALALGANAVMIGQPILHGLAVAGAVGVAHILNILRAELEVAMALTGRPRLATIDRSVIATC
ncbi:alpha-hydroxy acid oxidase [Aquamicrobium ahrensii]|uniref:4-hydroxymandelate oxidase n=1 Tax=Aquamicrobium ahrensii TaxID=469551 RepID=A0ABV2KIK8_9HYPH